MPSQPLQIWLTDRKQALDEIENAHRKVGGAAPGRRFATRQINYAYAVLLSSQFQGFCRDLHDECIRILVQWITPVGLQDAFGETLGLNRKLATGNPNPGNIGSDFNRFGVDFWDRVRGLDARNLPRLGRLEELNQWRNAIAHQDPRILVRRSLHLRHVKEWRQACENLAHCFDEVMRSHVESVTGASPW
jgi:HEPN superfamily RiboL-PSP-like protein